MQPVGQLRNRAQPHCDAQNVWATCQQSTHSDPVFISYILILSCHRRLDLLSALLPFRLLKPNVVSLLDLLYARYMTCPSYPVCWGHPNIFESENYKAYRHAYFSCLRSLPVLGPIVISAYTSCVLVQFQIQTKQQETGYTPPYQLPPIIILFVFHDVLLPHVLQSVCIKNSYNSKSD
jgi:hypothetical protein